jgi:hypothetical protein
MAFYQRLSFIEDEYLPIRIPKAKAGHLAVDHLLSAGLCLSQFPGSPAVVAVALI